VVTLLVLVAGAGFDWAKYTGTDLGATLAVAWHTLTGSDVPEGFPFSNSRADQVAATHACLPGLPHFHSQFFRQGRLRDTSALPILLVYPAPWVLRVVASETA
jgi:hypothetical protein